MKHQIHAHHLNAMSSVYQEHTLTQYLQCVALISIITTLWTQLTYIYAQTCTNTHSTNTSHSAEPPLRASFVPYMWLTAKEPLEIWWTRPLPLFYFTPELIVERQSWGGGWRAISSSCPPSHLCDGNLVDIPGMRLTKPRSCPCPQTPWCNAQGDPISVSVFQQMNHASASVPKIHYQSSFPSLGHNTWHNLKEKEG